VTETLALALRVGLSLTFVLGLMWLAARLFRGKLAARGGGALEVLARQQVGRGASVAVIRVADRALVMGVTEHVVTMLGEPISDLALLTQPPTLDAHGAPSAVPGMVDSWHTNSRSTMASRPVATGVLGGSILSPATWHQALHMLRERTVRRG
jgi:flagellar protein FliO/FliZ